MPVIKIGDGSSYRNFQSKRVGKTLTILGEKNLNAIIAIGLIVGQRPITDDVEIDAMKADVEVLVVVGDADFGAFTGRGLADLGPKFHKLNSGSSDSVPFVIETAIDDNWQSCPGNMNHRKRWDLCGKSGSKN